MEKTDIKLLNDNVFETIGKEWMLVTAGTVDHHNTMTASWGCLGWLWGKPVAVAFIRPERYTHSFIEANDLLTLSFLGHGKEARRIYNLCGSRSGRDCDKTKEAGLHPIATPDGSTTFEEARLTLECRKLYKGSIEEQNFIDKSLSQWYGDAKGGYHDVYVLEITGAYTGNKAEE